MNEAVWVGDKFERTIYVNPKFCEITEYSLGEMLGRLSYDFWTPESAKRVKMANEGDRKRGISSSYEGDLLTKSGKKIPVLLSGTPLPDGGTIGIITDLRKIREREALVEESLINRFDLAVQGSNDGLWYSEIRANVVSGQSDFLNFMDHPIWFSKRHKEILGYGESELPERFGSWFRQVHPDDQKRVTGVIFSALGTHSSFEIEYRIRRKDGKTIWASTRGEAKQDKAGTLLFVAGSFRDVTENRRTRESLAKRVREAHLLYQANAHMRMVHSIRRVFSDLARDLEVSCRETPGAYTKIEFDGRQYSKTLKAGKSKLSVKESIIVRGKKRGMIELYYLRSRDPSSAVFNNDRQALATLGGSIQKHVSSREIMERYERLIKKSVMGIFILQNNAFRFVNPKFARMLRYKGSELIGKNYCEVILGSACQRVIESPKLRKGCRTLSKGRQKNGGLIELEVYTQWIDYHGQTAVMGMAQDISRISKAEEKVRDFNRVLREKIADRTADLKRANQRLRSLNELKDEFIAVTSHELRSPLTAARGYLSFIVEDKAAFEAIPESLKDYFVRIHDNVEMLNNLVTNILDVSRIETGRFELYKKPTDIVDLIQTTIRNFGYQLGEKQLAVSFSNSLPAHNLVLNIDPIRMRQVFRNLLDNAVKYSPVGKKIHLETEIRGIGVQISIADEGIGIPKSQIFEVFDKFKQAKNSQSAYKGGAGLGLFIVKKIMELHGGMIWAESQLNKGTTFRLQLPLN
jgi:PAS domain S-box-containing protein